jgi:hypothetical protein
MQCTSVFSFNPHRPDACNNDTLEATSGRPVLPCSAFFTMKTVRRAIRSPSFGARFQFISPSSMDSFAPCGNRRVKLFSGGQLAMLPVFARLSRHLFSSVVPQRRQAPAVARWTAIGARERTQATELSPS